MSHTNPPKLWTFVCEYCGHHLEMHRAEGCQTVRSNAEVCDCTVAAPRSGLYSPNGGLHPELAAIITAASAYRATFLQETGEAENAPPGAIYVDYKSAAYRLAADLNRLITFLQEHSS